LLHFSSAWLNLNKQAASPKEIANEIDEEISLVSYHVKELAKLGFVEVVREEPRRGATEHFYRGTGRTIFYADESVLVPEPIRAAVVGLELTRSSKRALNAASRPTTPASLWPSRSSDSSVHPPRRETPCGWLVDHPH
jgi:DNA-binding transcriptional ArsR family regulator